MSINTKVCKAEIISFDIFDTLLFRPYVRPIDLFLHMEKVFNKPFFMNARIHAEKHARDKSTREDITLDEIYAELDSQFQDMKQRELDWEYMVLTPNMEMKSVWDFAKQHGKKIIVTSDMYLPTEFIKRVLQKNGFGDYDKLYVSGDVGKTKSTGTLFEYIIKELNIRADKILHIGDNKKSDYQNPRRHGIKSVLYPQIIRNFIKHTPKIDKFYNRNSYNLDSGILVSILAIRNHNAGFCPDNKNYWYNLGYEYAGPVIYGYTRFIENVAKKQNLQHIMFVARDGYTLQKVFQTFDNNIDNSYVYAPRFLNLICRLDYAKEDIKQSEAIIKYFCQKDKNLNKAFATAKPSHWRDYHSFIQNNKDVFIDYALQEHENYKKYLLSHTKSANAIGIVDTITGQFSSQKLIENSLGLQTTAMYWSVLKTGFQGIFNYQEFIQNDYNSHNVFTKNWDFMELLMTAPEYPISNIKPDGTPIYKPNPSSAEQFRKQIYPDISNGALDFANDIKSWFGGYDISLNASTLVSYVNSFIDYPTKNDIQNMSEIKHAYDSGHSDYRPLFSVKISASLVLHKPLVALRLIKSAIWRTPLQNVVVCICDPIKIRMRGLKQIRILLLPKLQHRYLTILLRITHNCLYQISVGKPKI
ncbi:MAG: HAD-IA family hydrolase [Muribaculaceae bacterium]|nr:HAD-IA family hydrolase [Muribaculaceae bacterium]